MEKQWMSYEEAEEKFGVKFIRKKEPRTIDKIIAKVLRLIAMIFVAGFATKGELLDCLQEFYTSEAQEKYGVVGIEIKKL